MTLSEEDNNITMNMSVYILYLFYSTLAHDILYVVHDSIYTCRDVWMLCRYHGLNNDGKVFSASFSECDIAASIGQMTSTSPCLQIHITGAYPGGCFGCLSTPISRSTGLSLILPLAREEANHIEPVLAIATNTPR